MNNNNMELISSLNNGVYEIILNRPEVFNSFNQSMAFSLQRELDFCAENDDVRVVVISGTGKAFCAGHDLKQMQNFRSSDDDGLLYFKDLFTRCSEVMLSINKHPKPVIAEVGGVATAAGCQLVASCDLAYANTSAKFATPGVNIGLFCSTPMVAISRNLSNKHSMEMLLTGELISSEKAATIGLINEVSQDDKLKNFVLNKAIKISKKSAVTLKIGKKAFYKQIDMKLSDAYDYASKTMVENMLKLDAKEGIDAFINKRKPKWQDK